MLTAPSAPPPTGRTATPKTSTPAAGSGASYTGPNPCTHALGGTGIIDQACARGGIKEAKVVMKDMVKKAKKQGMKIDCDNCHKDDSDWSQLAPDAKDRFKELLAIYQGQ